MKIDKSKEINIYHVLNSVIIFSSIAGVSTVKSDAPARKLTFSLVRAIFSFLLLLIAILHLLSIPNTIIYLEKKSMTLNDTKTNSEFDILKLENIGDILTKLLNPLSVAITGVVIRISALLKTHKFLPPLAAQIYNCDKLLGTSQNQLRKERRFLKIVIVITLLLSWPFQIYSNIEHEILLEKFVFFFNLLNNFSCMCCDLEFIIFCWILGSRFKNVNKKLMQVGQILKDTVTGKSVSSLNLPGTTTSSSSTTNNNWDNTYNLTEKLNRLKTVHRNLSCGCELLNDNFKLHLLFSITSSTMNVFLNIYFAIFGGYINNHTFTSVFIALLWSAYYLNRFIWICVSSELLTREGNTMKVLVANMLNRKYGDSVKEELWILLGYSTNREIKMTAIRFFTINITLITTAVATGTTYLVILAQIQKN